MAEADWRLAVIKPRIHVIPAAGCDQALVLRRGPAGQVASLLWDQGSGKVSMGQWLKGRIFEHRTDLSPDGRHVLCFARKPARAWTAISRAPWLRAVAFMPQDSTWGGGGAFTSSGAVWLNGADASSESLPDGLRPAATDAFPHSTDGFHMGDLFVEKMRLRGWQHIKGTGYDAVLRKPAVDGWMIELSFVLKQKNRALISNRYAMVREAWKERIEKPAWEWAEPYRDTIRFSSEGALWEGPVDAPDDQPKLIHDFTDMVFERREAPYIGQTTNEMPI